jgi:hypothetical protein
VTDPREQLCPECEGKGEWLSVRHAQVCGTLEDDEERERFHNLNCAEEKMRCRVCGGMGFLDEVALAIYKARGGAAPIQRRGFA